MVDLSRIIIIDWLIIEAISPNLRQSIMVGVAAAAYAAPLDFSEP